MTTGEEFPEAVGTDPWAAYLPGQELIPAYLTSRFAAQYRTIVDVMLEAQDTSLTGMSHDEVSTRLWAWVSERAGSSETADRLTHEDVFALDARLDRLVQWGVLTRWQEPARTGEDFLRRRDRFQLTPTAARLHTFWTLELSTDEDAAADLTLAPRAIHDRLREFAAAIADLRYPAAAAEFQQIITLHQGMALAARTWQRSLAHALSGGPDPDKQEVLWRTLQSYIGMWGEQVDIYSPTIADTITDLKPMLTEQVWHACVRGALPADTAAEIVDTQILRWVRTWDALGQWFSGGEGQARKLRRQLRDLVAPWARNMHILMDTGGALTRRAELLALARAIERAPDDATAWQMWDTAVGDFPARHLLIAAEGADEHTVSWDDAAPAPVTGRFREHGHRAAVGKQTKAVDHSAGRAAARRARAAAIAERRAAEVGLRSRSGTHLAEWGPLSQSEFQLLLDFLSVSRVRRGEQTGTAVTDDGRWQVTLTAPQDGATVALTVPQGQFISRNWKFELAPAKGDSAIV
ncbi:DUF2397 domain-containing protein [Nocardia cyriacigeorgica]|uniref:DUF2397 domain-containing protein n=1 Tax=Nocardia cyriacigeorgica TaxID=135487 RepID=UPI001895958F|nr:DUF2397 domain-containing protein [Nocardia cyriacigeorgica]MBF6439261.1 DUF2397 domain-containing protein [Nocardia cyriacigeorgica]